MVASVAERVKTDQFLIAADRFRQFPKLLADGVSVRSIAVDPSFSGPRVKEVPRKCFDVRLGGEIRRVAASSPQSFPAKAKPLCFSWSASRPCKPVLIPVDPARF